MILGIFDPSMRKETREKILDPTIQTARSTLENSNGVYDGLNKENVNMMLVLGFFVLAVFMFILLVIHVIKR